jgi:DNA-binding MarR family transcriptional regulator
MNHGPAERLHQLLMDLVLAAGFMQLDQTLPGQPISVSQAFALHELDTGVPLSQQELAARLRLEKSTVSRLAAELERKGLLLRERDPGNRRLYRLRLTDEGRAVHRRMAAIIHQQYFHWVESISETERDALLTGLSALVRQVHRDPPAWQEPIVRPTAARGRPTASTG